MIIKEINRNIKFDTRELDSRYRCKYGSRDKFDILRINMLYNGNISEVYEVESKFLPLSDSIHFKAIPTEDGFKIYGWTAVVAPYIHKV